MLGHDHGDRAELVLDGDWEALLDKLVEGEPGWQVPSLTMPNGTSFCTRLEGSNESVQSDAAESSGTEDNSVREHVEGLTTATALVSVDPTAKKFPNTYSRQKHEIGLLRQHAKALEDKLQGMAKPVDKLKSTWGARRSPSASQSWKELADVQRRRLLLVQRENRTLRLSALEQKRMAKNLQQILMRRVASKDVIMRDALSLAPSLLCLTGSYATSGDKDFAVFSSVCREIVAISRTPASALDVIQRKVPETPGLRQWHVRSDSNGSFFLEAAYCIEVPFPKADVDHAFQVIRRQAKANLSRYVGSGSYEPHVYGAPPGVRLTKSVVSCSSSTEPDFFRVYHANRSFVGDTHSVSFQVAYIDSAEEGRPIPGVTLKEHQWSVVTERTHVDAQSGRVMRSTMIQVASAISPLLKHDACWTREVAENAVIPVWNQVISLGQQNLENTLLDFQSRS